VKLEEMASNVEERRAPVEDGGATAPDPRVNVEEIARLV
jgi:hypothetical protein